MELSSHTLSQHKEVFDNQDLKESTNNIEEGEVDPEIMINNDHQLPYKFGSWGGAEKDGFSFGGKRKEFGQAVLDIQKLVFTNKEYNLHGVKFALVSKEKDENGSGQTYTIEIEKDGEKGKSVIKVWDKNSKNEYKMLVTKLKEHNGKWVKVLSEILKSLLDLSISGEGWKEMKSENKIKCGQCEKYFSSEIYLKSHTTKIHKEVKPLTTGAKTCPNCNKKVSNRKESEKPFECMQQTS